MVGLDGREEPTSRMMSGLKEDLGLEEIKGAAVPQEGFGPCNPHETNKLSRIRPTAAQMFGVAAV